MFWLFLRTYLTTVFRIVNVRVWSSQSWTERSSPRRDQPSNVVNEARDSSNGDSMGCAQPTNYGVASRSDRRSAADMLCVARTDHIHRSPAASPALAAAHRVRCPSAAPDLCLGGGSALSGPAGPRPPVQVAPIAAVNPNAARPTTRPVIPVKPTPLIYHIAYRAWY